MSFVQLYKQRGGTKKGGDKKCLYCPSLPSPKRKTSTCGLLFVRSTVLSFQIIAVVLSFLLFIASFNISCKTEEECGRLRDGISFTTSFATLKYVNSVI